jgi:phosphoesterase family protein
MAIPGRHATGQAVLMLGVFLAGVSVLPGEVARRAAPAVPASHVPAFDHIFVVIEENQDYERTVGNPELPFINGLITRQFLQTNYHALDHGSLPDYLGLVSGSEQLQAIGTPPRDCAPSWATSPPACAVMTPDPSNIGDLIEKSGRTWRAYLQGMEQPCRWQSDANDYEVIHNPFVYFKTIEGGGAVSSQRCIDHDVDLYTDRAHNLQADLMNASTTPNFVFIVPGNHSNMHDDRLRPADNFLRDILTGSNTSGHNGTKAVNILASPAWTSQRSIAYIVWDEDSGSRINHVVALAVGNWVNGPMGEDGAPFTHYSMLKTWEAAWNLSPIQSTGGDASASPMLGAFNLLDEAASGQASLRRALRAAHPEIFAQVDANLSARDGPATLLAVYGSDGVPKLRLSISPGGLLSLANGLTGEAQTSSVVFGTGWHTVALHVRVLGAIGVCEVLYDGALVAPLSQFGTCITGATPIGSFAVGDPAAGAAGGIEFRHLAVATSPI